ncbi:biotin synthase [uncultured Piscinibacter sp.]|uniref:class I SAM-dependent methyltransferase n=1 Tax=uncultured Piscinibacter sp. TaxID=1131835 RepID=UPI0026358EF3|nr:biotin synthase [uncultured Piscinibacter sp.]
MSATPAPDPSARGLDPVAIAAVLRRLARASGPPWLHCEVARRMAERLAIVRMKPAQVIDWWSWLGGGAGLLERAYPDARRIVVEPTAELRARSEAASTRPWWSARRWTAAAPLVLRDTDPLPEGSQLVWANMMLHAVVDPPALFARWQRALAVDGFVMFSCLGPGTLRELRSLYQGLGWPAPTPNFIDMHDLGDMLVHAGFADPVMDQEVITLQWPNAQALLDELRALGGNAAPLRMSGCRTPRWRQRLLHQLESLAGADGRPSLSFEVAYGHAFRAAPRAKVAEVTNVQLDDMRAMVRGKNAKPVR